MTATVTTMTSVSGTGIRFNVAGFTLCQLMVFSATIIITAASATIGICAIRSLKPVTSTSRTSRPPPWRSGCGRCRFSR